MKFIFCLGLVIMESENFIKDNIIHTGPHTYVLLLTYQST